MRVTNVDRFSADVLHKVNLLPFPSGYQLSLYISTKGCHWLAYAGMGDMADTPVTPGEMDAIVSMLKSGILTCVDEPYMLPEAGVRGYRIYIRENAVGLRPWTSALPSSEGYLLLKWQLRQTHTPNMQLHKLAEQGKPGTYVWIYPSEMGDIRTEELLPEDCAAVEALLAQNVIVSSPPVTWGTDTFTQLTLNTQKSNPCV